VTCNFGSLCGFTFAAIGTNPCHLLLHVGPATILAFRSCNIVSRYGDEADGLLQDVQWYSGTARPAEAPQKRHYEFVITAEGCEGRPDSFFTVRGRVLGFVPLRNRRQELITYLGEAFTEYTVQRVHGLDDIVTKSQIGFGMSEYLDQGNAASADAATAKL
jgi:hypothetical protein